MSQQRLLWAAFVGLLALNTEAGPHSRRLLNADTLSVQNSGATNSNSAASGTETAPLEAVRVPGGAQNGAVLMGSTGVTAPTQMLPSSGNNNDSAMMQQMLQALSGMGNSNNPNNGGYRSNSNSPSSSSSSSPSSGSPSSGPKNGFSNDSGNLSAPLPPSNRTSGRDCSATGKQWQPPTTEQFRTTSCFGYRKNTKSEHTGVDFVAENQEIVPVAPGKIVAAGWAGGYGCQVIVKHETCPQAMKDTNCYSQYGHLACTNGTTGRAGCQCPATGNIGQSVTPCSVLGNMGSTGNSTGKHLHFELRTGETSGKLDPVEYFKEWQAHKNYNYAASSCGSVGSGRAVGRSRMLNRQQGPLTPQGAVQ